MSAQMFPRKTAIIAPIIAPRETQQEGDHWCFLEQPNSPPALLSWLLIAHLRNRVSGSATGVWQDGYMGARRMTFTIPEDVACCFCAASRPGTAPAM